MIEVNLLPKKMRQQEGTPLPQFLAIIGGVLLVTLGGVFVFKYKYVDLVKTQDKIKEKTVSKGNLQKEVDKVKDVQNEEKQIESRLSALKNLDRSRIPYSKLFYKIYQSIPPQQCVFSEFKVTENRSRGGRGGGGNEVEGGGKAFKLEVKGYVGGNDQSEAYSKVSQMIDGLRKNLKVYDPTARPAAGTGQAAAPAAAGSPGNPAVQVSQPQGGADEEKMEEGYSQFLGLRFYPPVPGKVKKETNLRLPKALEEEGNTLYALPPNVFSFEFEMVFQLRPYVESGAQ